MKRAQILSCLLGVGILFTPATSRAADELKEAIKGKWTGDLEAFKKANPNKKDEVAETLHRLIEYEFTANKMVAGTMFDVKRPEVSYRVVREEKDRLTIEVMPQGKKAQTGLVVFMDKDHVKVTWDPEAAKDDPSKGLYLKRMK
jgi:hypothetical protein